MAPSEPPATPPAANPGADQTVFVIDDDSSTRELLSWLMRQNGIACETHAEPRSFLASFSAARSGCVVLDLHMPGMSGIELQCKLNELGAGLPVIFLSGRADVPKAVEAVKGGAFDFIEKPFDYKQILAVVKECLERDRGARARLLGRQAVAARIAALTQREREVMERVVAGQLNRVIAEELEVSIKTVEAHRAHIMEKLCVNSVAELVQAAMQWRSGEDGPPRGR